MTALKDEPDVAVLSYSLFHFVIKLNEKFPLTFLEEWFWSMFGESSFLTIGAKQLTFTHCFKFWVSYQSFSLRERSNTYLSKITIQCCICCVDTIRWMKGKTEKECLQDTNELWCGETSLSEKRAELDLKSLDVFFEVVIPKCLVIHWHIILNSEW